MTNELSELKTDIEKHKFYFDQVHNILTDFKTGIRKSIIGTLWFIVYDSSSMKKVYQNVSYNMNRTSTDGCAFSVAAVPLLLHVKFGSNDHQKDAPHFIRYLFTCY